MKELRVDLVPKPVESTFDFLKNSSDFLSPSFVDWIVKPVLREIAEHHLVG